MTTFIEQTRQSLNNTSHEAEDALIQGQICRAKDEIAWALTMGWSDTYWYYVYETYDSFIFTVRKGSTYVSGMDHLQALEYYRASNDDVGFGYAEGLGSHLTRDIGISAGHSHKSAQDIDYPYIRKHLEQELRALGCTSVTLLIGPQTITETRTVTKGSGFFKQRQKVEERKTIYKWMVAISW